MPRWIFQDTSHPTLHYARGIYDAGPHETGEVTVELLLDFYRKESRHEPSDRIVLSTSMGHTQAVIVYPGDDYSHPNRICKLSHPVRATNPALRGWDGFSHAPGPPTVETGWLPPGTKEAVVNWLKYGSPCQD